MVTSPPFEDVVEGLDAMCNLIFGVLARNMIPRTKVDSGLPHRETSLKLPPAETAETIKLLPCLMPKDGADHGDVPLLDISYFGHYGKLLGQCDQS